MCTVTCSTGGTRTCYHGYGVYLASELVHSYAHTSVVTRLPGGQRSTPDGYLDVIVLLGSTLSLEGGGGVR